MNEEQSGRKITIEDLLKLKRAERPAPEFWSRFEQELRAKQLAAIMEKRPWWRSLALPRVRWSRLQLPLGAAAIFTITLLSVREYRQIPVSHSTPSSEQSTLIPPASSEQSVSSMVAYVSPVAAAYSGSDTAEVHAQAVESSSRLENSGVPSSALLANESLAAIAESAAPVPIGSMLTAEAGFESRVLPSRSSIAEPLAQLATPKSVRLRDRYLGSAMPTGFSAEAVSAPAVPVDHAVRSLRDRQFRPEDFSRFDARGNSLSIKL